MESDTIDNRHWQEVMKLAEKYGFILQAYGGTATLATQENQKQAGIWEKCQAMNKGPQERSK